MPQERGTRHDDNGEVVHRKRRDNHWSAGKIASVATLSVTLFANVIAMTVFTVRVQDTGAANTAAIIDIAEVLDGYETYLGAPAAGATMKTDYMQRVELAPQLARIEEVQKDILEEVRKR